MKNVIENPTMHHLILASKVCITAVGMGIISIQTYTQTSNIHHTYTQKRPVHMCNTMSTDDDYTQQHGNGGLLCCYAHDRDY